MRLVLLAIVMALVAPSDAFAKDAVLVKLRDGGAKPAAKKAPVAKASKRKPVRRSAKKSVAKSKPKAKAKKKTESKVRPMP